MTSPRRTLDPDALLSEAGWVRSLARSLVPSDRHLADDLAQEACLAALKHAPTTERSLKSWLATVLRNLVRQDQRSRLRRMAREELAARRETQGSTLEHVETLSVHRRLVEAVLSLDEPYRETIVLRFFEELSPSAIAKRKQIPVATVKTRLARGLAELRARLEREYRGESRNWALALVPLCTPSGPLAALTLGTIVMSTKLKVAAAILLIAGLIAVAWPKNPAPVAADLTLAAEAPRAAPIEKGTQIAPEPTRSERTSALPGSTSPAVVLQPAAASAPLSGLLLDVRARPLPGLRVAFQPGRREISAREFRLPALTDDPSLPHATSGADGRFQIGAPGRDGELVIAEKQWTTVLSSLCRSGTAAGEHVVVAAPHLAHAGRVVDPSGKTLAGARIEIHPPKSLRLAFPQILDASAESGWVVESGPDGSFTFADAPRVEDATIEVSLTGYRRLVEAAPLASSPALELVLQPIDAQPGMVYGEVLDPHGQAVAGARVTLGHANLTLTDERGQFHLELPKEGARDPWIAVQPGYQPAIERASAAVQSGQADPGELVVLRLGAPPLSIRGRVVDEQGKGQAGWRVFVSDPTFFSAMDEIPAHVEGLLAGAAGRSEMEKLMASAPSGSDPEGLLRNVASTFWSFVDTDSSGNFVLEGLLDRSYRLSAFDPQSLLRIDGDPIPAGARDAQIRVPAGRYVENLRGRVLSAAGRPVPGVALIACNDILTVHLDEHSRSTFDYPAAPVLTDAEGRFHFARLPREQTYLRLSGGDIVPTEWGRRAAGGIGKLAGDKPQEIEVRVELSFHVQAEFTPDGADELRLFDSDGKRVLIHVHEGTSRTTTDVLPLEGGRSKIMLVGESAATLVLFKEKQEVRRAALALVPGQLNRVQI